MGFRDGDKIPKEAREAELKVEEWTGANRWKGGKCSFEI